jgi:protein-tyrosine-phosphatase
MASALAQYHAGDRIDAISAGSAPAPEINPVMEEVMREKGIDMAFRRPRSLDDAARLGAPDLIVSMGCEDACPLFPGVPNEEWDLEDPAGKPVDFMRQIRDDIERRVLELIGDLKSVSKK